MKLVLRAGFDRFSGYGNDAVDLAVNLARLGVEVTVWPTSLMPGLPRAFTRLLEPEPGGRKDVLLAFCDPATLQPWEFAGLAPRMFGYTMWERLPVRREDLVGWGRKARRWSAHGLDGLAVSCQMNLDAFRALDPQLPMLVVPAGIEPGDWPQRTVDYDLLTGDRPVRFLLIGVLAGRKDPFLLLGAWKELMAANPGLNAELVVHTYSPGVHPLAAEWYGPNIAMSQRALSRPQLLELYRSCDVLVSTSRGEGNNKPALEFQATGGTVIAGDWAGHRNWKHDAVTLLPGPLVPAMGARGAVEQAIDQDALVKALYWHATNPVQVAARGQRCARWVRRHMTWARTLPPLIDWLGSS